MHPLKLVKEINEYYRNYYKNAGISHERVQNAAEKYKENKITIFNREYSDLSQKEMKHILGLLNKESNLIKSIKNMKSYKK